MTQTTWKPQTQRVIEILPEELDDFQAQVKRFQAGEWNPNDFLAFRLRQGVYGQRQPDVHMVRVKVPFGGLTADQLDALGEFAEEYTSLKKGHATTRENFQFHHVPLDQTPDALRLIADVGLSTREACGNTVRNVTGCAMAGVCADEPFDVTPYAAAYSRYFVRHPFTQALPRKIKTAFSGCESDCAITPIHDVGFIPKIVDGKRGFKMVTGGGTSIMPRLAPTLYEFVPEEEYLKKTEAVLRVFHRSDELRKNRSKARIKFLIDRIGIDEFRGFVEEELKQPWAQRTIDPSGLLFIEDESKDAPPLDADYQTNGHDTESLNGTATNGLDPELRGQEETNGHEAELPTQVEINGHDAGFNRWVETNVQPQKQAGYKAVTVKLPLGDVKAGQFHQLAELTRRYAGGRARITHQQNLTLRWVPEKALYEVWLELNRIELGESGADRITDVVSCPGTDSCKLGITSSMGLGQVIGNLLEEAKFDDPLVDQMLVKMSGCPNGCGQHHVADIGFHGAAMKGPGGQVPAYDLFVGGSFNSGDVRFGQRVKARVPAKSMPEALKGIIGLYLERRNDREPFKDFVERSGPEVFESVLAEYKDLPELTSKTIDTYMDWDKTVKYIVERGEGECAV